MDQLPISEDQLLSAVIECARWNRWLVHHIRNSRWGVTQGDVGFPDLVLVKAPSILYVELKREKEQLRQGQVLWSTALTASGAEYYVWRPSDWRSGAIEERLTR
jgi:VRR-NUC domain